MDEFDFNSVTPRRGSHCSKWDSEKDADIIPMWVADMDFRTAPCIIDALHKRVEHGIFGYTEVPASYYDAVRSWFGTRHGWDIDPSWIMYVPGVVPATSAIIKALVPEGGKVLIQAPAYNCFFSSIRNNGCTLSETVLQGHEADGKLRFEMDFEDFEAKVKEASIFLLCNPHNPSGRVWSRDELIRMGEICLRHNVPVLSDEIHCELVAPGHKFIPFATVSEEFARNSITMNSPSKAFNIAGLQIANIICERGDWRKRIDKAVNINEVCDVNAFGIEALEAAYRHGTEWLEALNAYIHENYEVMARLFTSELPQFKFTGLEGTYLAWVDISATGLQSAEVAQTLHDSFRVRINPGSMYDGEGYIRINLACPRSILNEGLSRIVSGLKSLARN